MKPFREFCITSIRVTGVYQVLDWVFRAPGYI